MVDFGGAEKVLARGLLVTLLDVVSPVLTPC